MEPGPKLNDRIAREFFGWEEMWIRQRPGGGTFMGGHFDTYEAALDACEDGWVPCRIWTKGDELTRHATEWSPSEDIADAWVVFASCIVRFGQASIRADAEDFLRGALTAGKADQAVWVQVDRQSAFGPAPLAICEAALFALASGCAPDA